MNLEKAKGVNKNVARISHNKYKDVLLNNKYLLNRIQIENHKTGTWEINKNSVSWFGDKIS